MMMGYIKTSLKICLAAVLLQNVAAARNITGPARTSCEASYSAPCSRVNSEWLATDSAKTLTQWLFLQQPSIKAFDEVTAGNYNMEEGFYPFVFDRTTAKCVAHGNNPDWVGKTLQEIFQEMGIGFSLADELHQRFVQAAENGGDESWVGYMWREDPESAIENKIAYVTEVTDQYYLGVGYTNNQLPLELPCTDKTDSWCSINNVRSLVGKAETALKGALSLEQFESTLHDISFDRDEYFVEGGHYLFMYHYDGPLKAHFHLNRFAGESLPYIFEQLNRDPQEGADLHVALRDAAEGVGDGWVQYKWKNKPDEPEYIKIAYVVQVKFMGQDYYLGCGFNFIMGDVVSSANDMALATRNEDYEGDSVSCPGYNLPCSFGNTLQLSSHTLAHGLSSPLELDDAFAAITDGSEFKIEDWGYAFMFDFNGTCVAHAVKDFVGLTGNEIFKLIGMDFVDGVDLHNRFRKAAELGGGFVLYDWSDADTPNDQYQKVSYIFKLYRDGRDYYGGVGFNHERAPLHPNLDTGFQGNGEPIPCVSMYGSACSELNAQAILGQALGDLVLASSETKVRLSTVKEPAANVSEVFSSITAGSDLYRVNDFHIAVFSLDQSLCEQEGQAVDSLDDSGCCVAHGGNSSYVGMTWQGILDSQSITSIRGRDLHDRLIGQIDSGGAWMEYSWAQSSGGARPKVAFSSRFRDGDQSYYIVVEYFAEAPPPTCDACPSGYACTQEGQFFCQPQQQEEQFYQTAGFIILMLVVLGVPCLGVCFCYIGKKREERMARAQLQEYDQQMQTMTQKMQHQEKTAKKANRLVASLFPQQVQERVMQQLDEEENESSTDDDVEDPDQPIETKEQWNKYMAGEPINGTKSIKNSAPIADLFPAATISFADIVGFTAWSSTREPSQVFHLLESIYRKFDKIAHRMKVFKVETVGDCYVAVCGLPEQRDDHPIVMARFSTACLSSFKILVQDLELELGPGTADLKLRCGLHSGPVTAGVLRGERGRFQLFGDTVNTAARMESTGKSNQVHLSQEFVDLLLDAGKSHWVTMREDKVVAKGKGVMNTFWLNATCPDLVDQKLVNAIAASEGMSSASSGQNDYVHPEPAVAVDRTQGLVEWNLGIMKGALAKVIASRQAQNVKPDSPQKMEEVEQDHMVDCTSLKEVKDILKLQQLADKDNSNHGTVDLDDAVVSQLRAYIYSLSSLYNDNPFHNFQHATHVTMSVVKLMSRICSPEEVDGASPTQDYSYGITSNPLTQFTVLLSALIHDVDHPGVPNGQLIKENGPLTAVYAKSLAELNSLDLAWGLLMDDKYIDLRRAIYSTEEEFLEFRQLLVNIVLATDVMDKDLGAQRKERWTKAFAKKGSTSHTSLTSLTEEDVNRKATIVLEHLIQASDVAHTMQHWNVYAKWNERFFNECYAAYQAGRADKDPSENWYKGEIGFFDFYVIPLAKKLKDCGVFGVSSAEYLRYAEQNRKEWEARGQDMVASFMEKIQHPRRSSENGNSNGVV